MQKMTKYIHSAFNEGEDDSADYTHSSNEAYE